MLVTHPVDRRLATRRNEVANGRLMVRAKIVGDAPTTRVEMRVDDGQWAPMAPVSGNVALWQAPSLDSARGLRVRARDARGRHQKDGIELSPPAWTPPVRAVDGRNRIGARPDKGLLDTQLGPNRGGRKW